MIFPKLLLLVSSTALFRSAFCEARINDNRNLLKTKNVGIIGAGMSGLTAAFYLQRAGYNITIFEKDNRVGGQVYSKFVSNALPVYMMGNPAELAPCETGESKLELGAVIAIRSGIPEMADAVNATYKNFDIPQRIILNSGRVENLSAPPQNPLAFICALPLLFERFFFERAIRKYPEIFEPGLSNHHEELFMPFKEFAKRNFFPRIGNSITTIFVATGYGYAEDVPAAYYMKQLAKSMTQDKRSIPADIFPCGYSTMLESVAATFDDVRLNTTVVKIVRPESSQIVVTDQNGVESLFDQLVIAGPLKSMPDIMDVDEEEKDLFERITSFPYLTSYFSGTYSGGEEYSNPVLAFGYEKNQVEEKINHLNLLITEINGTVSNAGAWQILDDTINVEEATEVLKQDLSEFHDMDITEMLYQEYWPDYFPRVSSKDFFDGFHDRIENLQGQRGTYYLGAELSFHSTNAVFDYAKHIVETKFPRSRIPISI